MIDLQKPVTDVEATDMYVLLYSAAVLYRVSHNELSHWVTESNMDKFEEYIRQVEKNIFDGPLSTQKIEKQLRLIAFSENMDSAQARNIDVLHNSPFRDTIVGVYKELGMQYLADEIESGQRSRPNAVSLSEKKCSFQNDFGDIVKVITQMNDHLQTMQQRTQENSRIVSLLERCEKCKQEINRILSIVHEG